jgi:hypothetical protein
MNICSHTISFHDLEMTDGQPEVHISIGLSEILGSQGREYKDDCLLGCCTE